MRSHKVINTVGIIFMSFSVLICSDSRSAEIDSFKVGQVTGAYLGATDLMIKVSESDCKKFLKRKYNFDTHKNEVLSYLNEQDKKELVSFLDGDGMRLKRKDNFMLIESYLNKSKSEGLSDDFVCGSIVGIASTLYADAIKDWNLLKEEINIERKPAKSAQDTKEASEYCDLFGDIWLENSYYVKNDQLEKELYKLEITDGKWSRSYRKAKHNLETREVQFNERKLLIDKMCEIRDIYSSEYFDAKLKIEALEEVLGMYK